MLGLALAGALLVRHVDVGGGVVTDLLGWRAAQTIDGVEGAYQFTDLAPGTYWISYVRSGYVPIGDSETETQRSRPPSRCNRSSTISARSESI